MDLTKQKLEKDTKRELLFVQAKKNTLRDTETTTYSFDKTEVLQKKLVTTVIQRASNLQGALLA